MLAVGPAINPADAESCLALLVPSVGSAIEIENRTYRVMAVVSPLQAEYHRAVKDRVKRKGQI